LHQNGLVHRDIKPSNVIFVDGESKLADIGLATAIDEAHSMVDTVGYIPPEGPGAPQADLYSLGKVLYEIAFGKERQDFPQLPLDLPSHPDYEALLELNEVILKACESDPRRRYASATAGRKDLALLECGQSVLRKRAVQHRFSVAKRIALVVFVLALLLTALPFIKGPKRKHVPNPEAARLYELGKHFYNKLTREDHATAFGYLNQAVQADPQYIQPYGEMTAICVWSQQGIFASNEERIRKAKEIADKLIPLDPKLAERHIASSYYKFRQHDWAGAEVEIDLAIKLNPNYAFARDLACCTCPCWGEPTKLFGRRSARRNSRPRRAPGRWWPRGRSSLHASLTRPSVWRNEAQSYGSQIMTSGEPFNGSYQYQSLVGSSGKAGLSISAWVKSKEALWPSANTIGEMNGPIPTGSVVGPRA